MTLLTSLLLVVTVSTTWTVPGTEGLLGCIDPSGNEVGKYFIYKLPYKVWYSYDQWSTSFQTDGSEYLFFASSADKVSVKNWELYAGKGKSIADEKSAVGRTLTSIYENDNNKYIDITLYNDNFPGGDATAVGAHSKGVLFFDKKTKKGFWMLHSVPGFPFSPNHASQYGYSTKGFVNGQHFFCQTLRNDVHFRFAREHLQDIGAKTYFKKTGQEPTEIWESHDETSYPLANTTLGRIVKIGGTTFPNSFNTKTNDSTTVANEPLPVTKCVNTGDSFDFPQKMCRKNDQVSSEEYCDLAKWSKMNLYAQTWAKDDTTASACINLPIGNVENVASFKINAKAGGIPVTFGSFISSKDHSKWAVPIPTNLKTDPLVCFGDLNRVKKHYKRGGGIVCVRDATAYGLYFDMIY